MSASSRPLFGLLDAGLAALSTFAMGTSVVRLLPNADLALYSSMFAAFVVCALLPTQLVYVPSQISANVQSGRLGTPVAPDLVLDLRRNWVVVALAAVITALLGLPLAAQASWPIYWWAAGGILLLAVFSPHQSHARSVMHIVGRHGAAVTVSLITLLAQLALLAPCWTLSSSASSRPATLGAILAATGVANALGSVAALVLARRIPIGRPSDMRLRVRFGLLSIEVLAQGTAYLAVLIVAAVLGTVAVAHLEAARVVASPIQIFLAGLLAFAVPDLVRAVTMHDRARYSRRRNLIGLAMLLVAGVYAGVLLISGSAVGRLLGRAVDGGLAAARVLAAAVDSLGAAPSSGLVSRQRVVPSNIAALVANIGQLSLLPSALALLGPVGLPLVQLTASAGRVAALNLVADRSLFGPTRTAE